MSSVKMGGLAHFHGHLPRHQKMCQNPHTFLGHKNINGVIKNFLLKNSFPKNKEKDFINRFNARARQYTRFQKYVLTIYASSSLLIPSTDHLCVILSLTIVRVRRENFSFSKICIDHLRIILSPNTIYEPSMPHLSTIFQTVPGLRPGPAPARRDVLSSRRRIRAVLLTSVV